MRRFIIARIAKYYSGDQLSEDELGGAYGSGKEIEKLLRSVNLRADGNRFLEVLGLQCVGGAWGEEL
jgi:hypothetical protein